MDCAGLKSYARWLMEVMTNKMTTEQIRNHRLEALRRELGVVGMVRFQQLFETGRGDYTEERHQWLDHLTMDDIVVQLQAMRERK